jgi:hypothetical protein
MNPLPSKLWGIFEENSIKNKVILMDSEIQIKKVKKYILYPNILESLNTCILKNDAYLLKSAEAKIEGFAF